MTLLECFDRHDCDKGSRTHRYDRLYEKALASYRDREFRLLEIGILRGQSIAAWLDYFPRAQVIGVDNFSRVKVHDIPVLFHQRVEWHRCDSTERAPAIAPVDVVIDDGYHTPEAQAATFKNFFPLLKPGGTYFIEDIDPKLGFGPLDAVLPPGAIHHDLRKGFNWGSYVIEIRK
jgi:hypothetical protein